MSVFLRWGIFGILSVAGLVYAYNASKSMAEKREAQRVAAGEQAPLPEAEPDAEVNPEPAADPEPAAQTAPHCQAELVVAQRALDARRRQEPLDRLLRIQEIAWQEPLARRQWLEKVATRWYQLEGEEPIAEALSIAVIKDCERFSPAP
ncbi:MAG TPA: hypothetical protein VIV63_16355 [Steroidobacteraceae bacterium]